MTSKCQFPSDRQPFNTKRPSTVSTTTRTQTPATFSIRPAPIKNSRRPRTAATQTAKASSQLAIARSLPLSLKKPTRYTSQSSSTPQTNQTTAVVAAAAIQTITARTMTTWTRRTRA